tara:strand:- start:54 stop:791 length:738 start_codon:yes stop_codon:yes gene_type:complete
MATPIELQSRIKEFFRYSRQESTNLIIAIIVTGFIFSFRDWGEQNFSLLIGLKNFLITCLLVAISFIIRFSWQKISALNYGYKAEFEIWFPGIIFALLITFLSVGKLPLILIGSVSLSFMVRHRLGEFRYGFSHKQAANVHFFGIAGNLALAILFGAFAHSHPDNYIFVKAVSINLWMALCSLLPLPHLDGVNIFFGSRLRYYFTVTITFITIFLIAYLGKTGIIIAIILGALGAIYGFLTSSRL